MNFRITKNILVTFSFLFTAVLSIAQIKGNLVPNPGFDEVSKKIKEGGQIELATGWLSPTEAKADLYSKDSKNEAFLAPDNAMGREETKSGNGYAGIVAYSYKGSEPRTYLQAQLTQPLEAGKRYCIRFHTTVSELSKYAVDNMGLYVSKEAPVQKEILAGTIEPQVIHSQNKVIQEMDYWKPICRVYKAEGGENFITIGNFASDDKTKETKMKRPSGFTKPQQTKAYYYVEDVLVVPVDQMIGECVCEKETDKVNVVYNSNISEEAELKAEEIIKMRKAFFPAHSTEILDNSFTTLDEMVNLLIKNQEFKLELIGNTDPMEQIKITDGTDISLKRAESVREYLIEKGVNANRLQVKGLKDSNPLSEEGTAGASAQNRRVDFVIIK